MNRKASIIVVNWNGKRYLEECLSSLLAQTYSPHEIILVDNGSHDGSVDFVTERFSEVRIIQNGENLGFAAGNNVAIRIAQGDYIVTLNNDTRAEPDWLEELVRVVEADPKIGMCASKMLFYYHTGVLNSTGISLDIAGIAWDRRGGERDEGCEREPVEIFGPCAGAALYRREMLNEVGLFDEDFFAYHEDVDLAWRARSRGWRCMYNPQAVVYHVHSGTGMEGSAFKNRLLGRNKIWTMVKNYPTPQVFLFLPLITFYDLASVLYSLLKREDKSPLQGRLASLGLLPEMLRKRREIQRKRTSSVFPWFSPLVGPVTMLKRYERFQSFITSRGRYV
jgi:GT2 family glycosyltransferase